MSTSKSLGLIADLIKKDDPGIMEGLRTSHCADPGRPHGCVGKLTVHRAGINLECKRCGDEEYGFGKLDAWQDRARDIMGAIGFDYDCLSPIAQINLLKVISHDPCPGCEVPRKMHSSQGGKCEWKIRIVGTYPSVYQWYNSIEAEKGDTPPPTDQ